MSEKKKTKRQIKEETKLRILIELTLRDREWFGLGLTVGGAKRRLKSLGIDSTGFRLGSLAKVVCQFWRRGRERVFQRPIRGSGIHDAAEWAKLKAWCIKHREEFDLDLDTYSSIARRCPLHFHIGPNSIYQTLNGMGISLIGNPKVAPTQPETNAREEAITTAVTTGPPV